MEHKYISYTMISYHVEHNDILRNGFLTHCWQCKNSLWNVLQELYASNAEMRYLMECVTITKSFAEMRYLMECVTIYNKKLSRDEIPDGLCHSPFAVSLLTKYQCISFLAPHTLKFKKTKSLCYGVWVKSTVVY